jgi:UPF0755 protein
MKIHWSINILLYLLGACFNVMLLALVVYMVYTFAWRGFYLGEEYSLKLLAEKPDKEVEFVLNEDTPLSEAAGRLEELGVISNQYYYRLEMFLKKSSTIYKAGTYTLNQNMSNTKINATLHTQPVEILPDNVITIPEGYNIRDIAMYLEDRELVLAADFLEACDTHDFDYTFLNDMPERANRLEGYLFPDTYFISPNPTPDEIINKMLTRFDDIFSYEYRDQAAEMGYTIDEIVTIAAIIEKEVRVAAERPKVSEVIYNRLRTNTPLQMCSTVLYVLDKKRDRLLESDLQIQSPYNTYIQGGLPIGPIASPGADCIRAALYPDTGNLMYFVLQDDETGEHYFTNDYNAFLNAKARYNQQF